MIRFALEADHAGAVWHCVRTAASELPPDATALCGASLYVVLGLVPTAPAPTTEDVRCLDCATLSQRIQRSAGAVEASFRPLATADGQAALSASIRRGDTTRKRGLVSGRRKRR